MSVATSVRRTLPGLMHPCPPFLLGGSEARVWEDWMEHPASLKGPASLAVQFWGLFDPSPVAVWRAPGLLLAGNPPTAAGGPGCVP